MLNLFRSSFLGDNMINNSFTFEFLIGNDSRENCRQYKNDANDRKNKYL